ncbi:hypothetical protein [Lysobacter capsici]|uniref:hypothetical protein n=1 Tax=Lysobacter capsici TaxID=435897 RepID=UPI001C001C47|nr:hypothetical protein [Lysobacter capsici]QWF18583.1 hypothetical protein KME82_07505 [Lysobacter capsici]
MRACLECQEEMDTDFCPDCGEETDELIDCPQCGYMQADLHTNCLECDAEL